MATMANANSATARRAPSPEPLNADAQTLLEVRFCAEAPAFRLQVLGCRVCVERRAVMAPQREIAQYAVFDDETDFLRWCDADAIKFSYPLLHRRLTKTGSELFSNVSSQKCGDTASSS